MKPLLLVEDSVFHQIAQFNNLEQLFPSEKGLKHIKLSPAIIDKIFEEFKFKYLNKKSTIITILKNVYNTYFGRYIIKSDYDKNNHTEYTCPPVSNDVVDFCKKYLILDNETKITYNDLLTDNAVAIEI